MAAADRELWLPVPSYCDTLGQSFPMLSLSFFFCKMDTRLVVPISQGCCAEFSRRQSCENILLGAWPPVSPHKMAVSAQRS